MPLIIFTKLFVNYELSPASKEICFIKWMNFEWSYGSLSFSYLVAGSWNHGWRQSSLGRGSTTWDIIIRFNNKCLLELKRRSDRVDHTTLCGQGCAEVIPSWRHISQGWQFGSGLGNQLSAVREWLRQPTVLGQVAGFASYDVGYVKEVGWKSSVTTEVWIRLATSDTWMWESVGKVTHLCRV
jgi:hypothetical protein